MVPFTITKVGAVLITSYNIADTRKGLVATRVRMGHTAIDCLEAKSRVGIKAPSAVAGRGNAFAPHGCVENDTALVDKAHDWRDPAGAPQEIYDDVEKPVLDDESVK